MKRLLDRRRGGVKVGRANGSEVTVIDGTSGLLLGRDRAKANGDRVVVVATGPAQRK